jgi:hypothetical protein
MQYSTVGFDFAPERISKPIGLHSLGPSAFESPRKKYSVGYEAEDELENGTLAGVIGILASERSSVRLSNFISFSISSSLMERASNNARRRKRKKVQDPEAHFQKTRKQVFVTLISARPGEHALWRFAYMSPRRNASSPQWGLFKLLLTSILRSVSSYISSLDHPDWRDSSGRFHQQEKLNDSANSANGRKKSRSKAASYGLVEKAGREDLRDVERGQW